MQRKGLALLLAFLCASAWAGDRRYLELVTDDFSLISGVSEKRTRDIAAQVGMFRAIVEQSFGVSISRALPMRIHALPREDWIAYASPREQVAGYFVAQPFSSDLLFDADDKAAGAHELMLHEYMHYILRTFWTGEVPPFLDEGLAEVFSTARLENGKVRISPRPDYVRFLRRNEWLPFERLLQVKRTDMEYLDHGLAPGFYAQSWATVYYAMALNPAFGERIMAYLRELNGGGSRIKAAERLVGAISAEANRDIGQYIRTGKSLPAAQLRFVTPPAGSSRPVRFLSDEEAKLALGELMLRLPGQHKKAGELFGSVLRQRPHATRAQIGAAWARLQAGDATAAAAAFDSMARPQNLSSAEAVALARGLFQVAAAGSQQSDELSSADRERFAVARELFAGALTDESTRLEAVNGYVLACLALADHQESLIALAQDAYRVAPRSSELAVGLAILHEVMGKKPLARRYWEEAARNSHTAPMRARISEALEANARDSAPGR